MDGESGLSCSLRRPSPWQWLATSQPPRLPFFLPFFSCLVLVRCRVSGEKAFARVCGLGGWDGLLHEGNGMHLCTSLDSLPAVERCARCAGASRPAHWRPRPVPRRDLCTFIHAHETTAVGTAVCPHTRDARFLLPLKTPPRVNEHPPAKRPTASRLAVPPASQVEPRHATCAPPRCGGPSGRTRTCGPAAAATRSSPWPGGTPRCSGSHRPGRKSSA